MVDLFGEEIVEERQKDWTGSHMSMFRTLGASNHCYHERQTEDYYATSYEATEWLCKLESFEGTILEPACGEGHISEVLKSHGYEVVSRDLINRGYGESGRDFLRETLQWDGAIITNPPYKYAQEFVEKALKIIPVGQKIAMFLKVLFLEGKSRKKLFQENPPVRVWVSSSRLKCALNGDFEAMGGSAVAYAWFIWEKGFRGTPQLKWFN